MKSDLHLIFIMSNTIAFISVNYSYRRLELQEESRLLQKTINDLNDQLVDGRIKEQSVVRELTASMKELENIRNKVEEMKLQLQQERNKYQELNFDLEDLNKKYSILEVGCDAIEVWVFMS